MDGDERKEGEESKGDERKNGRNEIVDEVVTGVESEKMENKRM